MEVRNEWSNILSKTTQAKKKKKKKRKPNEVRNLIPLFGPGICTVLGLEHTRQYRRLLY